MTHKKKALPDDIGNFFQGESVFFRKSTEGDPTPVSAVAPEGTMEPLAPTPSPLPKEQTPDLRQQPTIEHTTIADEQQSSNEDILDVMTSSLHDVNLKEWQEIIENTETQNSALRLTSEERYAVEDVVNDLRRNERVKTSMNEIARLGILLLIHDYKKRRHLSILYGVKKA